MPRNGRNRAAGLRIDADTLLLVEGRDEVNLFDALVRHSLGDETKIQVIDAGGVNKFPGNLRTIREIAQSRPSLRSMGVVRDADDDADGAFHSICGHLHDLGYTPPAEHGAFSDAMPSIGVFIVPNGSDTGAIETLCRHSVEGSNAARCVDEYIECLDRRDALLSRNTDKTFAHAYLAATNDPVARVGEGAKSGVWNFDSPAFTPLSQFLRDLAGPGAR